MTAADTQDIQNQGHIQAFNSHESSSEVCKNKVKKIKRALCGPL